MAVAATHALRVWQARALVWSEQGGRAGGRQCFIEQHGMAVGKLSGAGYRAFMRREVFLPLGMTRASVHIEPAV